MRPQILCILILTLFAFTYCKAQNSTWGLYRGVSVAANKISKADLIDLSRYKVNLIRLTFSSLPLVTKKAPYNFNEVAFMKLEEVLKICESLSIKVVIDPHTSPGFEKNTTTNANDEFWKDEKWQVYLVKLWQRIAHDYKSRGNVIAGYDLLNEPSSPMGFPKTVEADWNLLVAKLVKVIRNEGDNHSIIIETSVGKNSEGKKLDRIDAISNLKLPDDRNLVVSPHMYQPHIFTHQGVEGQPKVANNLYPGVIDGENWDKNSLEIKLKALKDFEIKNHVPIYIGEFSASRNSGLSGNQYLKDLIQIFEKNNWSWTYHMFRAAPIWDAELSVTDLNDTTRKSTTPRMQLLNSYFRKNK